MARHCPSADSAATSAEPIAGLRRRGAKDLDGTAKAVTENLSGRALCEYDRLFGDIKRVVADQRIVLASTVRELGVTRLEGDRAGVLVFVDQTTTRGDNPTSASSGAQLGYRTAAGRSPVSTC